MLWFVFVFAFVFFCMDTWKFLKNSFIVNVPSSGPKVSSLYVSGCDYSGGHIAVSWSNGLTTVKCTVGLARVATLQSDPIYSILFRDPIVQKYTNMLKSAWFCPKLHGISIKGVCVLSNIWRCECQGTPIENGHAIFYICNIKHNFGVVFSPLPDKLAWHG